MNKSHSDAWVDLGGPETGQIQKLLDEVPALPRATPEDKERVARRILERLDAELSRKGEPSVAAGAPTARVEGERRVCEEGVTVRSPTFDERAVAPPPTERMVVSRPVEAPAPRPVERHPVEDLTTTSVALELPAWFREQLGRLPFRPRPPGEELARTMKVPELNPLKGATTPMGEDLIKKEVAAVPFPGSPVGAAIVPFPRLTLEGYASLRAELSLWPALSAETLRRYYVPNEAARRALVEHWQVELAASPEMRARFDKAFTEYMAWLWTKGP